MKRPLGIVALSMTLALAAAFFLSPYLLAFLRWKILLLSIPPGLFYLFLKKKRKWVPALTLFLVTAVATLSAFGFYAFSHLLFPLQLDGAERVIHFTVKEEVGHFGGGSYRVLVTGIDQEGMVAPFELILDSPTEMRLGTEGVATAVFSLPQNSATFDYRSYLASQGIFLKGVVKGGEIYLLSVPENIPFLERTRVQMRQNLTRYLNLESRQFVTALLLGDRSDMSVQDSRMLSRSGLTHLIAISGSHFTLLGVVLAFLLKRLGVPRKAAAFSGIAFALFYMVLVGENPAAWRAGIMESASLLAVVLGRKTDFLTSLSFSAIILYLRNPFVLQSASFTLSYGAVLSIYGMYPWFLERCKRHFPRLLSGRVMGYVTRFFLVSLVVTIGLAPLTVFYFRRISLVAPISGVLANPLTVVVLLGGFFLAILGGIPFLVPLFHLVGVLVEGAVSLFWMVATFFGTLSFSSLYLWGTYLIVLFIGMFALLFIGFFLAKRYQNPHLFQRSIFLSLLSFLVVWQVHLALHQGDVTLFVLEPEKSNCFMVYTPKEAFLFIEDARSSDGKRMLSLLEDNGVDHVAAVVLLDDKLGSRASLATVLEREMDGVLVAPDGVIETAKAVIPLGDLELDGHFYQLVLQNQEAYVTLSDWSYGRLGEGGGQKVPGIYWNAGQSTFLLLGRVEAALPDAYGNRWARKEREFILLEGTWFDYRKKSGNEKRAAGAY